MTVSGLAFNQLQYQSLKQDDIHSHRQDFAASAAAMTITVASDITSVHQQHTNADSDSSQQESFLHQLMEQMMANRIGLNKQKYDELQQKIEQIESEIEALNEEEASPTRDTKLAVLDDKLTQLNNALEGLVEEANRNRERAEQVARQQVAQYSSVAQVRKESKDFL
jgi:uncharacterized protein with von Willebrand factor type A (vWA) domain